MLNNIYEELKPILDNYPIRVKNITIETEKEKKAVWWVDTDNNKYILKKVSVAKDRLLFLLSAIVHLRANGINIPLIQASDDGNFFVEYGGEVYILMEAVVGSPPRYTVESELALIMESLARFHRASKNFAPPPEAKIRSHLGNWRKSYQQLVSDLEKFKDQALLNYGSPFEQFYLDHCPYFIEKGKACQESLLEPPYTDWVTKVRQETNLCHQDFAAGNLGLVKGTLYVYDMDSITIDLPARDLRKILNKVMKKQGHWDPALTVQMLSSYQQISPLTADEYYVLFTDIGFPHLFHGIASKYFESREQEWPIPKFLARLKELTTVEKSKEVILEKQEDIISSLINDVGGNRIEY